MIPIDFTNDPMDLTNALNLEEDLFTPLPIDIKPSKYYEFEEFNILNSEPQFYKNFSMMSFNIHSLHGKYEELRDLISYLKYRFSIICLQEVWSVSHDYPIPGYRALEHVTRDALLPTPNRNCGGGVGIYISEHLTYTKLDLPNSFVPGVFKSIWIKVKINKN